MMKAVKKWKVAAPAGTKIEVEIFKSDSFGDYSFEVSINGVRSSDDIGYDSISDAKKGADKFVANLIKRLSQEKRMRSTLGTLRKRSFGESNENAQYSNRGFITDWRYVCDNGKKAGDMLRSGEAKLLKGNAGRIFLKVEGDKEYRVRAGLAKGIKGKFWFNPDSD